MSFFALIHTFDASLVSMEYCMYSSAGILMIFPVSLRRTFTSRLVCSSSSSACSSSSSSRRCVSGEAASSYSISLRTPIVLARPSTESSGATVTPSQYRSPLACDSAACFASISRSFSTAASFSNAMFFLLFGGFTDILILSKLFRAFKPNVKGRLLLSFRI